MASNSGKDANILASIGTEMKSTPPSQLARTTQKYGPARAKKQKVAILLSKARKAGAGIPGASKSNSMTKGGSY